MTVNGTYSSRFDLERCARPNILALKAYRCARDDYKDDGSNVLLDANENAYGPGLALSSDHELSHNSAPTKTTSLDLKGLNRYPDPHQVELKQSLCQLRNTNTHTSKTLDPSNLFVGVGSDEAIDALIRCFCVPSHDKLLTCPPTYGMYEVSAQVNDVAVEHVPLLPRPDSEHDFDLDADAINDKLSANPSIKIVYLCSPGNPTGKLVDKRAIQKFLEHPTWNGIVTIDEAYVDFSPDGTSLAEWVTEWPNLVVMQTLSKAFGLAGIRLGAAFASPPVARLLNNFKAPYNVSSITSQLATQALEKRNLAVMRHNRAMIIEQRQRLVDELRQIRGVGRFRGSFHANFLLVELLDRDDGKGIPCNRRAMQIYERLAEQRGVVVRFRGKEYGCEGCLRITVGTEAEVTKFLDELRSLLAEAFRTDVTIMNGSREEVKEKDESAVVA